MTTYFLYGLFCLGFIGLMCIIDAHRQSCKKNEALAVSQENARAHLRYRAQLQGRKL